ncbi:hypothetical protein GCM10027047_05210 [Rhodococcus aerolatus]
MRRTRALTAATVAAAAVGLLLVPGSAGADPVKLPYGGPYEVGLFGDMPYGDLGRAQYPAVLADMNAHPLAFSLFDGDMKNGSEPCYAAFDGSAQAAGKPDVYLAERDAFSTLRAPVIATPGDNEWTDCDRPATKGPTFDANGRLAYERQVFFSSGRSQGRVQVPLTQQSAQYPENQAGVVGPVVYATVNVPGSDNNFAVSPVDGDVAEAQAEYAARNPANLAWINAAFDTAEKQGSKGVVLTIQADMFPSTNGGAPSSHFADTIRTIAKRGAAFGGQVLLVNGDSHSFLQDKPFSDDAGNVIQNITRVTTFGSAQDHWVSMTVNPNDPQVFTVHQHVVAANVPAYTFSS